ncbi:hypothetical protein [Acinetobacter bereziniae]|uniref:hypothetical protein n=1 Tax=Acinetobacter bereziniae TaxID=106648 RepID=UPI0005A7BA1F|nr:hypothetical protein [Acinetobacter bereziniae]
MKLHLRDGSILQYKTNMELKGLVIDSIELEFTDNNLIPEEIIWCWDGKTSIDKTYSFEEKMRLIETLSNALKCNDSCVYEHSKLAEKKLLLLISSL